jgi:outer membrane lipoprotein-sorting protein
MKNSLLTCCLLLMVSGLWAQDADKLLLAVKSKLESVKDYTGDATLSVDVSFMNVPDSRVKVYFRQPDQFKILKPDGISILPKGGMSISLNSLISGKEFTAVPGGYTSMNGRKLAIIKLLPIAENSDIVLSTLLVEEKSGLVWKATTTTRENGTYESILEYGRFARWGLPDKILFVFNTNTFKLPKGVTMEYEGSKKAAASKAPGDGKGRVTLLYSNYLINTDIKSDLFK